MSFTITDSSYQGQRANEIFAEILYATPTLGSDSVKVLNGIKTDSTRVPVMSLTKLLRDGSSGNESFTSAGTLDADAIQLDVDRLKINLEFSTPTLMSHYMAAQVADGIQNDGVPNDVNTWLLNYIGPHVGEELEEALWLGVKQSGGTSAKSLVNGLLYRILTRYSATPGVGYNKPTYAALTATNVIDKFRDTMLANSKRVLGQPRSQQRFFCSIETAHLVESAKYKSGIGSGTKTYDGEELPVLFNVPVIATHGVPDNVIIHTYVDNLWIGTDILADYQQIDILNQRETTGSDTIRVVGFVKVGTQIFKPNYVSIHIDNPNSYS